jgi:acid phosphatase family membrane protein YuiD
MIFKNVFFISAAIAWFLAQLIKIIICFIKERRLNFRLLVASGGMPSSHTSSVCALTTSIAYVHSFDSPLFAISAVFALIVMYDASGVRRAAGEQAKILNRIMDDLKNKREFDPFVPLKELVGHTPIQVFAGAFLGIAIGILYPLLVL